MRQDSGNTSIYIRDKNLYLKRISEIRQKWYDLYMEHLSTSDILLRGLEILLSSIDNEESLKSSDNTRKVSDKYIRVGE